MQFEECHIPGQNTFLNPHFYSVLSVKQVKPAYASWREKGWSNRMKAKNLDLFPNMFSLQAKKKTVKSNCTIIINSGFISVYLYQFMYEYIKITVFCWGYFKYGNGYSATKFYGILIISSGNRYSATKFYGILSNLLQNRYIYYYLRDHQNVLIHFFGKAY